jgi:hypothetical protein
MRALLEPAAGLFSSQTATNPSTPVLIFNGPVSRELGVVGGGNCLGAGWRPNAAIGRSVRLLLRNIGGERPGITDPSTHGQAGKFTFCFAEAEDSSPWEPWHVSHGLSAGDSAITVVMGNAPQSIFAYGCNNAADLLSHVIGNLTALGHMNILFDTGPLLIFSPEHADVLAREGYGKSDVQAQIFQEARIPLDRLPSLARVAIETRRANWFQRNQNASAIGVADRPEDVHIVVAGGAGIHSVFVSTSFSSHPVIRVIQSGHRGA